MTQRVEVDDRRRRRPHVALVAVLAATRLGRHVVRRHAFRRELVHAQAHSAKVHQVGLAQVSAAAEVLS